MVLDTNGRFRISDTIGRFWISDTSVRFWISDTGGLVIILNGSGQFCVLALADFGSWTLVAVSSFGRLWHGPFCILDLVAVSSVLTLATLFKFWALEADFAFWTLVADFGFQTPVTNFVH